MFSDLFGFFWYILGIFKQNTSNFGDEIPKYRVGEHEMNIGFYQAIELTEQSLLLEKQSNFQNIQVHQSKFYGKILLLDDVLQLTERDADSYNEMLAHIPMFQHANPKRVLVIGGGDGYALTEVLKHDSVEHVDHIDLDGDVLKVCEEYFPQWGTGWKDARVKLHISDGAVFVMDAPDDSYDVIIQDSSDPFVVEEDGSIKPLPSGALYESKHFRDLHRILKKDGVLMIQAESYNIPSSLDGISTWRQRMIDCGFVSSRYGSIMTSSYPTGQIGFLLAEKDPESSSSYSDIVQRYEQIGNATSYYHPPIQRSSFDLPLWVHNSIYNNVKKEEPVSAQKDQEL